jgi:hypothetical protein
MSCANAWPDAGNTPALTPAATLRLKKSRRLTAFALSCALRSLAGFGPLARFLAITPP